MNGLNAKILLGDIDIYVQLYSNKKIKLAHNKCLQPLETNLWCSSCQTTVSQTEITKVIKSKENYSALDQLSLVEHNCQSIEILDFAANKSLENGYMGKEFIALPSNLEIDNKYFTLAQMLEKHSTTAISKVKKNAEDEFCFIQGKNNNLYLTTINEQYHIKNLSQLQYAYF